ncbi:MAG: hypothetical protein AABY92_00770, partial [Thermodesulfobacteriota bacterium]
MVKKNNLTTSTYTDSNIERRTIGSLLSKVYNRPVAHFADFERDSFFFQTPEYRLKGIGQNRAGLKYPYCG